MAALQLSARQLSATNNEHSPSTMLIVAVANVAQPEQGVEIIKRISGQNGPLAVAISGARVTLRALSSVLATPRRTVAR